MLNGLPKAPDGATEPHATIVFLFPSAEANGNELGAKGCFQFVISVISDVFLWSMRQYHY
jgi:hypothetical protein